MYSELLSEADSTKELEGHLETLDKEINQLKDKVKNNLIFSRDAKRQFDVLEHVYLSNAGSCYNYGGQGER